MGRFSVYTGLEMAKAPVGGITEAFMFINLTRLGDDVCKV
jgi:hypothetical protein